MAITLLQNARIFDGRTPDLSEPVDIVLDDGRFRQIAKTIEVPSDVDRYDLDGRTVMPGLIDAHFHAYASDIDFVKLETLPPTYLAQRARHLMEGALQRGFTTVRDV